MGIQFYFGIFFSAGLAQWIVWKQITGQVNRHLPASEQYKTSAWAFSPMSARAPMNQIKIWRLHRHFFRDSKLRLLFVATLVLMFSFFLLCIQFDRSHTIAHPAGVLVGNHHTAV
jgi:hypothetical protein